MTGERPPQRLAYVIAIWFGCGRVPRMPGTAGTLGALPLYFAVAPGGPLAVGATALAITAVGIWAASIVARQLGTHDPQIVCVDEVAGVLVALTAAPRTAPAIIAAVVLFRLFDQFKPWPARALERLPGGWGIVLDDIAAGLWSAAAILLARRLSWL